MGIQALVLGSWLCGGMFAHAGDRDRRSTKPVAGTEAEHSAKLLAVDLFAFGGVGIAGTPSEGEQAFEAIVASTNALQMFRAVLKEGTPEGKLYALCGIRRLAPGEFKASAEPVQSVSTQVRTASGCMMTDEAISSVVKRIETGYYDRFWNRDVQTKVTPKR